MYGAVDRPFAYFIFYFRPHPLIEHGQRTMVYRESDVSMGCVNGWAC